MLSAYPAGGDSPLILAGGTNNLLGPRSVVVALKAGEHGPGQAPPYTGPPTRHDEAAYYLFLPFNRQLAIEFHLEGDVGVVDVEHGGQVRFRASTGVPLDTSRRGGLSEDAWDARRRGLLEALFQASVRGQAGDPEAGALILEQFAAEGSGSPDCS